ncbi:MAG: ABC transporter ATP-binding protein [Lachnospiraceae bacterium]|nr:ABC transporter ATP-binding protein [Lachnospiraceae bacterium]
MRNIVKTFGKGVYANRDVDLDIYHGEILSLLGENGSGKTTLMNMLSGIYYPDEGEIFINSKPVSINSPKDAYELGIGMVHQHFKLVDVLTAAENIVLGLDGALDLNKAKEKIREICARYGFEVDPDKKIYSMSVSEKQTVEIVKVLYRGADILILDEPTAVLTPQETKKLFEIMRNMKKDGKALVIITHKLAEVMEISDRVAILRQGKYVGTLITKNTSPKEMTDMMVGRKVELGIERPEPIDPKLRLRISNLSVTDAEGIQKLKNINLDIYSGEILGIAGISGCGQKELLESVAGLQKVDSGSIIYYDDDGTEKELVGMDPVKIKELGVALSFVPEDRLGMGLVGDMDLSDNMMLRSFRDGKGVFTDRKSPHERAEKIVKQLHVDTPGIETPVRKLSGGNIQKVLVGRELYLRPSVLMTAYVVRGLDINSSYTIYDLIVFQKLSGTAVIFVGEDLDVLLQISDRVCVLCDGQVNGILDGRKAEKSEVGLLMTSLAENHESVSEPAYAKTGSDPEKEGGN